MKSPVQTAMKKSEQQPRINVIKKDITYNESFHFSPAEHEIIIEECINLYNQKMKLLKTFLQAVSMMYQMYTVLFYLIPGMEKICLIKII